jgi:hypothetical protein
MKKLPPLLMQSPKPWTPDKDQLKGVKWLIEHACAGLLADPGVGKTAMTLAAFKWLKGRGLAKRMLVIAPMRVAHQVWPAEVKKWADFNHLSCTVLHGTKKEQLLHDGADIHVVNLEGLEWLFNVTKTKTARGRTKITIDRKRLLAMGYDILALDELSKYKTTSTNRFKMMREAVPLFGRRWGGTGSPVSKNLMGLFGQAFVLDEGRSFGQYITRYQNEYFDLGYDGFTWTLKEGAESKIYKRIRPLMLRLEAKGLPEAVTNDIMVDLPPEARRVYKELERDLYARVQGRDVVAANAGVKSGKCRQVAAGGIYLEPDVVGLVRPPKSAREWVNLHMEKMDALEDLVDELQGEPILVAYEYEHDLDRIRQRFGADVPYIGSGVSAKKGIAIENAWNAGEIPLLFGHPQSIGHGCNMQGRSRHVAWPTPTHDFELYDQFIRRVLRRGNKFPRCTTHRIIAKGTVDEDAVHALDRKEVGQKAFFEAMKTRLRLTHA